MSPAANGDRTSTSPLVPAAALSRPKSSHSTVLTAGAAQWCIVPSDPRSSAPKDGTLALGLYHRHTARRRGTRPPTGHAKPPDASPTAPGNGRLA
eukprot:11189765-Lingulodinium_polyedra.AAC.1